MPGEYVCVVICDCLTPTGHDVYVESLFQLELAAYNVKQKEHDEREECLVEKRNVEIHQWEVARAARQREEKEEKERQYRTSHFLPSDDLLSGVTLYSTTTNRVSDR